MTKHLNLIKLKEPKADAWPATLTRIEFRGNFCRLSAVTKTVRYDTNFFIDVPWEKVKDMSLQDGSPVYLWMPKERVLNFVG